MKKIRLFSTRVMKSIEGDEAELYVDFYLVLNKKYIFTFLIDAPNLACSGRNPIKLWKDFLIMLEEEYVKYMRKYEKSILLKVRYEYEPVEGKPGYVWLNKRNLQMISIETLAKAYKRMYEPRESEV